MVSPQLIASDSKLVLDSRTWLQRYGGNVGGAIYGIACTTEFSTFISQNIASSVLMAFGVTSCLLFGHKNKGLMVGALLNLGGTLAGISAELGHLSPLSLTGGAMATVGISLIAASEPLTQRFENSKNKIVREFLGKPRKWGAFLAALSNVFIVPDKLLSGHDREGIYYALLSLADIFVGASRPEPKPQSVEQIQVSRPS